MTSYELDETVVSDLPEYVGADDNAVSPDLPPVNGVSGEDDDFTLLGDAEDADFGADTATGDPEISAQPGSPDLERLAVNGLHGAVKEQHAAEADPVDVNDKVAAAQPEDKQAGVEEAQIDDELEVSEAEDEISGDGLITDEASFNRFFTANSAHVVGVLVGKGMPRADAEDAAQTAFMRAWDKRESFDGKNSRAWVTRIAVNASTDMHRKDQRGPQKVTDDEQQEAALRKAASNDRDPADAVVSKEDSERAMQILRDSGVSDQWAQILLLKHGYQMPDLEVAGRLGVKRGTVASGANRGMQKVRDSLESQG